MSNRNDDLFHLIGKLESSLEAVKERKVDCDKCFCEIKEDIKNGIIMLKTHEGKDKIIHKKQWKYIYYCLGLIAITILFCISIAKEDDSMINFLSKMFDIFA